MSEQGMYITQREGSRRRLRAAYERRFTGEVPFYECYVAEEIVDQVMGRPLHKASIKLDAADYVEFLQRTGMDAGYLVESWPLARKNKIDGKGRVHYVDGKIKSRKNFNMIQLPTLDNVRRRIESFLEAANETKIGTVYGLELPDKLGFTAIGPQDFCISLYQDPNFVNDFFDRVEEYTLPLIECVVRYPLDAVWLTGPFCSNAGPMISPRMHEEFIFPRVEKALSILRPTGIPLVMHTDGDSSMFMDWIIEKGFSAVHPIEPGIGRFDIYKLKERYGGRICLHGNIDVAGVLSTGKPDEVWADTVDHIRKLAPGGGYICGSSHDITENVPIENFASMVRAICSSTVAEDGSLFHHATTPK
jgi:uroporphyrinogen decarboxylase